MVWLATMRKGWCLDMSRFNCMFDTNVFNRILDGIINFQPQPDRVQAFATHIQRDELNNTKDPTRRAELLRVFKKVGAEQVPTIGFVCGLSRCGAASLGGRLPSEIQSELDRLKKKHNNVHDSLIAATSIGGRYILVTGDENLAIVTEKFGGKCLSIMEFWELCAG